MNIEKIDNQIIEGYNWIMQEQEKSNKKYLLISWSVTLVLIIFYFSNKNIVLLYISLFLILSNIMMIYKNHWFKSWFKYGYLRWKNINLVEYNTEKLKN